MNITAEPTIDEIKDAPSDFSHQEKAVWEEIYNAIKSIGYKPRFADRIVMHEYVKIRIMRDNALAAWNEKPERYVKIVTGIEKDMKTPKITIKENEHYAIMLDCNKQIEKILDSLKLTPRARSKY